MQNFDEDEAVFAHAIRTRGELHAPAGEAKVSFLDTRDLAAATAAVFATDGHDSKGDAPCDRTDDEGGFQARASREGLMAKAMGRVSRQS